MTETTGTQWPTVKLQTNIPFTFFIKYADYAPGRDWADPEEGGKVKKLPDQLSLRGLTVVPNQPPQACRLYVGLAFIGELCAMGALEQLKQNTDKGHPRYQVKSGGRAITIVKREEGKKKPVFIHWADEPEGPPAGTAPAQPATAAKPAAPAATQPAKPADTPREQRPAKLKTATEINREAALQLLQSGKAARNRLGQFSTTFEACLQAADVVYARYLHNRNPNHVVDENTYLTLVEKIAVHFSIQMAHDNVHVVPRERLEELKRLAGVVTKPQKEKPPMTAAPAAPVIDNTPSPLPPSERDPMELDGFDEDMPDDDDLPY